MTITLTNPMCQLFTKKTNIFNLKFSIVGRNTKFQFLIKRKERVNFFFLVCSTLINRLMIKVPLDGNWRHSGRKEYNKTLIISRQTIESAKKQIHFVQKRIKKLLKLLPSFSFISSEKQNITNKLFKNRSNVLFVWFLALFKIIFNKSSDREWNRRSVPFIVSKNNNPTPYTQKEKKLFPIFFSKNYLLKWFRLWSTFNEI